MTSDGLDRVFSGIQPTGPAHIGNYLGAIRRWVADQDSFEAFYCVVDLHAMTVPFDPADLRERTLRKAAELIACGLDPERVTLFVQSHVHEHAELAWVLGCVGRIGELRRMTQFKERSRDGGESVSVGLFTYPVLQAADVLLYQARGVPVGEDQKQHVELMRDLAGRFNSTFGETFVLPSPWIPNQGARIMALDAPGEKMSKSSLRPASMVLLVEPPDAIQKKIRSAVTDPGREVRAGEDKPGVTNLLTIFSLVTGTPVDALEEKFATSGYAAFKQELADAVVAHLAPIRSRYEELMSDPGETVRLLARGAERARPIAAATMLRVRERAGLTAPAPVEARWSSVVRG